MGRGGELNFVVWNAAGAFHLFELLIDRGDYRSWMPNFDKFLSLLALSLIK